MYKNSKLKQIKHLIKSNAITFARAVWCDLANITRSKACHTKHLNNYLQGIEISKNITAVSAINDIIIQSPTISSSGKILLVPDISTLHILPFANHHMSAMADMIDEGKPWQLCARSCLKKMIVKLNEIGIQLKVGFESEFYILKKNLQGIDKSSFGYNNAINENYELLDRILTNLASQNIDVFCFHSESGFGQHEISLSHIDPLSAADSLICLRETIHATANQYDLLASFLPKIFLNHFGSGCHAHMSLFKNKKNIMFDTKEKYGLSKIAASFIAGILKHHDAILAFNAPIKNSYKRLDPQFLCPNTNSWGIEDRSDAIRLVLDPNTQKANNIEVRTIDGVANPYLALSAIIAAGMDGIQKKLELPKPGSKNKLPLTLNESLSALEKDEFLQDLISKDLCQTYLAIKKYELNYLKDMDHNAEVHLLLTRY